MRNWTSLGPLCATTAAVVATIALSGCATPVKDERMRTGVTTSADVQQYYGTPTRVWPEADGGRTLEYATQPFGQTCYMVRLDAQDRLVGTTDALSAANRARIVPGLTTDQVTRMLGQERKRIFFRLSEYDVWDWNIPPEMIGYLLRLNFHFKNGVVVRTSQSVVYPDRRFLWDD